MTLHSLNLLERLTELRDTVIAKGRVGTKGAEGFYTSRYNTHQESTYLFSLVETLQTQASGVSGCFVVWVELLKSLPLVINLTLVTTLPTGLGVRDEVEKLPIFQSLIMLWSLL